MAGWLLGILNADGSYTALVTDRAGSVRLGVDDRGAVRFQQEFLPFGEPAHAEYSERPTLGFLGREQDMETGLLYLKNRYYDPGTARFLSPDPMRGAGLPEYAYGLGDPLTYSDPDGLAPEDGEGSHQPVFSLPEIVVRAGRVLQRDALHWFVERITRLAQGGDDFRGPWRGVSPEVPVPGPANQLQHLLEGEAVRFLRQVHDGFCPECRILPSSTVHRLAVTAQGMTARAMIVHEAISLARVSAALDRAKSLTPAQKDAIRLRAGVTLLAEVTFDELGLLGLQLIPAGSQEAEILAALLEGREGISEFDDQSFEGFVPGYDDTSAAGFNPGAGAPPR